jgi:hypothetical protein
MINEWAILQTKLDRKGVEEGVEKLKIGDELSILKNAWLGSYYYKFE